MPASRSYTTNEIEVEVGVEGDLEDSNSPFSDSKNVYFTDQSPEFEYRLTNHSDYEVDTSLYLTLSYQESADENEVDQSENIDVELSPGEVTTGKFAIDMLSYQGTAAVSVRGTRIYESRGEVRRQDFDRFIRLYTFMVYDRDYYRVNYLRPRYAQYGAAILSFLIVSLAALQIYLTL